MGNWDLGMGMTSMKAPACPVKARDSDRDSDRVDRGDRENETERMRQKMREGEERTRGRRVAQMRRGGRGNAKIAQR